MALDINYSFFYKMKLYSYMMNKKTGKKMIQLKIKSDQQYALSAVQSAIEAKIKRIEIGLQRTEEQILKFESKYQISSEHFLSSCTADDLEGGDDDYVSWKGELELQRAIREELNLLKDIEYSA